MVCGIGGVCSVAMEWGIAGNMMVSSAAVVEDGEAVVGAVVVVVADGVVVKVLGRGWGARVWIQMSRGGTLGRRWGCYGLKYKA